MEIFFYLNDNMVELLGLKDQVTEAFVNDATVTAVMKDAAGDEVTGQTWPLTLVYITASDGVYRGVLDAALDVELGDRVTVEATVSASGGRNGFFSKKTVVRERT